ncbi:MAG: hypothetical protein SPG79_05100, partial [Candidatus Faecousia sp.]|nr:hypothetical protein [Candidatus Faecousia sp.]
TNLLTLTYDTAAVGDVPVTVSYLDFSGSFYIHVSPKQVESFVLTEPGKLSYIQGEDLDLTGGKLDIQYTAADGSGTPSYHEEVPLTASMISGYDKFGVTFDEQTLCYKPTYQTLTVTYGGQTEKFLVLVKPFVLSAQVFWEGETLQVQISLNEDVNAASCFFIAAAYRNGQMVEANMISADRSGQLSSRFYKIGPDDTVRLFVTDHSYHPLISAVDVYLER